MVVHFKRRYEALNLAIDANHYGIPAMPIKDDKQKWHVEYSIDQLRGIQNQELIKIKKQ